MEKKDLQYQVRSSESIQKAWEQNISKVLEKVKERSKSFQELFLINQITTSFPAENNRTSKRFLDSLNYFDNYSLNKLGILKKWLNYIDSNSLNSNVIIDIVVYESDLFKYMIKYNSSCCRLNYIFKGFKSKPFDIQVFIQIHFKETYYTLTSYQQDDKVNSLIQKRYGEPISKEERDKFAKQHVKMILNSIKENLK
jgi:hypothetical protein